MNKIEIKGPYNRDTLERISIFLDNNHIKHDVVGDTGHSEAREEFGETIDWPL